MTFAAALAAIGARPDDPDALADLAEAALSEGRETEALAIVVPAARRTADARLWQWIGLLHRRLDDHASAIEAFEMAARGAPQDGSIAHGRARVALEAGLDARALFDAALKLSPAGDVWLGRTAAYYAMGEGDSAREQLRDLLDRNPQWAQGHVQWAHLAAMTGQSQAAAATVERALAIHPRDVSLWEAAYRILSGAERFDEALGVATAAIEATGDQARFGLSRAGALSDVGEAGLAGPAFEMLGQPGDVHHAILLARHLIRTGNITALLDLTDRWMGEASAHHFWPYASVAWRLAGDPRWQWLEGDTRLIGVADLRDKIDVDRLAEVLRKLHARSGRFLDQSVRGGTQTDGPLLSRIDPEIRQLRKAIVEAVEAYRKQLPPIDETHPMLGRRRDGPVRFAGSWSVRLSGSGLHSNHVHPQGWISSALYLAVPPNLKGDEGSLALGEPQAGLGTNLPPFRRIAPKPGQLVLFPSMMWHGTASFAEGERLTVAFDVAPPR